MAKGMLFDKPQGPSVRRYSSQSTISGLQCEGCGTSHPELSPRHAESYDFINIFGYQIVEQCCGAWIDQLYDYFGEIFFGMWANEFNKDPLTRQQSLTRIHITYMVKAWAEAAQKAKQESEEVTALLPDTQ